MSTKNMLAHMLNPVIDTNFWGLFYHRGTEAQRKPNGASQLRAVSEWRVSVRLTRWSRFPNYVLESLI